MKKSISLALVATTVLASSPAYSQAAIVRQLPKILGMYNRAGQTFLVTIATTAGVVSITVDCRNARVNSPGQPLTSRQVSYLIQQVCRKRG